MVPSREGLPLDPGFAIEDPEPSAGSPPQVAGAGTVILRRLVALGQRQEIGEQAKEEIGRLGECRLHGRILNGVSANRTAASGPESSSDSIGGSDSLMNAVAVLAKILARSRAWPS